MFNIEATFIMHSQPYSPTYGEDSLLTDPCYVWKPIRDSFNLSGTTFFPGLYDIFLIDFNGKVSSCP